MLIKDSRFCGDDVNLILEEAEYTLSNVAVQELPVLVYFSFGQKFANENFYVFRNSPSTSSGSNSLKTKNFISSLFC